MEQEAGTRCVKLRHNPFQVFQASKTPAGLYARQKWLGESDTSEWQDDFHETTRSLMKGRSDDGSWNQSPLESVRRLFGLHLTVRNRTGEIEKALGWLMKHMLDQKALNPAAPFEPIAPAAFRELPFSPGRSHHSLVCATLFLATIFQRGHEPAVITHYRLLCRWVTENKDDPEAEADMCNALRSFIVHPDYADGPATAALVDHLGEIQDPSGRWPAQIPFFQTINALAHLRSKSAHRQWVKALQSLLLTQTEDGSWGHEDLEWNTFLAVHALKNKACL
jgi:hypothetical protein